MRIAFAQTEPVFGDVAGNLERAGRLLDRAEPFDLLVLPELFSTGYVFRDRAELGGLAEDPAGATIAFLKERAARHHAWLCAGFAERDGDRLFNASALVGPDGSVLVYRKIHLFDRETLTFDPGDGAFEAHDISIGGGSVRVGMMICFDWFFPESARCLALDGAEILLHPSNLVLSKCQGSMPTRCLENAVYAITSNRTGSDDRGDVEVAFTGRSQITGPGGDVLATADATGECTRVVEIDVTLARDKRITDRNDRFGDRRPATYERIGRDTPR
ncbi:acyltransferase [bacterium]|nr:acyltransferase [bacterium]